MSNFIGFVLRFILKLVFAISAAIVAIGLLLVALLVVAVSLLKSLVTGRRPNAAVVFARFHQFSQQRTWPGKPTSRNRADAAADQIVDVEAHEVKDSPRQP